MNNLLFRVAEVEERLLAENRLDRLPLLESFKYRPIRSYEESQEILREFNHTFGW